MAFVPEYAGGGPSGSGNPLVAEEGSGVDDAGIIRIGGEDVLASSVKRADKEHENPRPHRASVGASNSIRRLTTALLVVAIGLLAGCAAPAVRSPVTATDLPVVEVDDARCGEVVAQAQTAEHDSTLVVLLVQVAAGGPPQAFTPAVREHLAAWADAGAVVRIVRFGGRTGAEIEPDVAIASSSNRHEDRAADIAESLACLERDLGRPVQTGVTEGVATLSALQLAGRMPSGTTSTNAIVIGSGVDTERPLDLRVIGFSEPVEQVVDDLVELDEIPRLDVFESVILSGTGQVTAPQPELPQGDVEFVRELWQAIVESAGSTPVLDSDLIPDRPPAGGAPSAPTVAASPVGQIQPRRLPCDGVAATVPNTFFDGDSAQLRPGVEAELGTYADLLRPGSGRTSEIVGHAHAVEDPLAGGEQELSEQRAATIADALVRLGADPSALTVSGRGATEPVPDGTPADDRRVEITIAGTTCD